MFGIEGISAPEHRKLFTSPGVFAEGYDQSVEAIQVNDTIEFSDGKVFKVLEVLGEGDTSKVLRVGKKAVIRIQLDTGPKSRRYFNEFWTGYEVLSEAGVDMVKPYFYLEDEYILVSGYEKRFSLKEYRLGLVRLTPVEDQIVKSRLVRFAASTYRMAYIGDFRDDQVVYTHSDEWLLGDWDTSSILAEHVYNRSIFFNTISKPQDQFHQLGRGVLERIFAAIFHRRINDMTIPGPKPCDRIQGAIKPPKIILPRGF